MASAGQYDFQTVVTHELGHGLGLGHSSDTGSVMYPEIGTAAARRTMVGADLNVAQDDVDGSGLHVEPLMAAQVHFIAAPQAQALTQNTNVASPAITTLTGPSISVIPGTAIGSTFGVTIGSFSLARSHPAVGTVSTLSTTRMTSLLSAADTTAPGSTGFRFGFVDRQSRWSRPVPVASSTGDDRSAYPATEEQVSQLDAFTPARARRGVLSDSALDELAIARLMGSRAPEGNVAVSVPSLAPAAVAVSVTAAPVRADGEWQREESDAGSPGQSMARLAALGIAAGLWAHGSRLLDSRKRGSRSLPFRKKSCDFSPSKTMW